MATFVRQLIFYVGLVMASAKFSFESTIEMAVTLSFIAIIVWWIGDRTRTGLILSSLLAIFGTLGMSWLAKMGIYTFPDGDFAGVHSWVPAVLFGGYVTCGALGRLLSRDRS